MNSLSSTDSIHQEAEKLREWAKSVPVSHQIGDWEVAYSGWPEILTVWMEALTDGTLERHLDRIGSDALYLVARDAERRGLIRELRAAGGETLLAIARLAVDLGDFDVQLLCARELADLGQVDTAHEILKNLADSRDECVRIVALTSLVELDASLAEQLAIANWHRASASCEALLVSIYALIRLNSFALQDILKEAELLGDNGVRSIATVARDSVGISQYGKRFSGCSRSQATIETGFRASVRSLREWASGIPLAEQVGEWACSYFDWEYVYRWWDILIRYSNSEVWSFELAEDARYAIARDIENMVMIGKVGKQGPVPVLRLTRRMTEQPEPDLQYQCAIALGNWVPLEQGESLLLDLASARESWVRQAALRSLAKLGSHHVESIAEQHWVAAASDPFAQMAILDVLSQFNAPRFEEYLKRAEASGSAELMGRARLIRDYIESEGKC